MTSQTLLVCLLLASTAHAAKTKVCGFTAGVEGPAADAKGQVYAVNFAEQGSIGRISAAGIAEKWTTLPDGGIGNGMRFTAKGRILVADYAKHRLHEIDPESKSIQTLFEDKRLNQPNDLAIAPNGNVYLSDPDWNGEKTGGVWLWNGGKLTQVQDGMGTPNGIEVDRDGRFLFVGESGTRTLWRFSIEEGGTLSARRKLLKFQEGEPDGLRFGPNGNLFVSLHGAGKIAEVSVDGRLVRTLLVSGKKPSNLAFAPGERGFFYVTEQEHGCVEKILF